MVAFLEEAAKVVDDYVYTVTIEDNGYTRLRAQLRDDLSVGFKVETDCWEVHDLWTSDGYATGRMSADDETLEEIEEYVSELIAIGREYLIQRPDPVGFFFPRKIVHMPHRDESLGRSLGVDLGRILSLRWITELRAR